MYAHTVAAYNPGIIPQTKIYEVDGTFDKPGGKALLAIQVDPAADLAGFKIGSAVGLDDIIPAMAITAAAGYFMVMSLSKTAAQTLYIGGITSSTTIRFYKL
jgi:hypothetical protein